MIVFIFTRYMLNEGVVCTGSTCICISPLASDASLHCISPHCISPLASPTSVYKYAPFPHARLSCTHHGPLSHLINYTHISGTLITYRMYQPLIFVPHEGCFKMITSQSKTTSLVFFDSMLFDLQRLLLLL